MHFVTCLNWQKLLCISLCILAQIQWEVQGTFQWSSQCTIQRIFQCRCHCTLHCRFHCTIQGTLHLLETSHLHSQFHPNVIFCYSIHIHFSSLYLTNSSSKIMVFICIKWLQTKWLELLFILCLYILQKYYEFIDTWIHLIKRTKPGILQIFHHIGAVITMWYLVKTENPTTWIFVILNSLIHTFMYAYYCSTTLGFKPKWKVIMTLLQICQFFLGLYTSFDYFATEGALNTQQACSLSFTQMYVAVVLYLFCDFFFSTYSKKPVRTLKNLDNLPVKEE